ncbi:MAG: DUF4339 domain-containing protein [Planctomycetes bacterium]|nr:DUF4339 domain-containing protein [Planctomycetota bacterium]MBL7042811.1 DUF4339 domain-containing protein [Pirellulaceae bacterium]
MPIETKCPGCQRLLRVPDEHAGKQARCPACNTIYVVPGGEATPETSAADTDDLWYMKTPEGQVYGPVSKGELDRWLSDGRISAECTLRTEDESDWRPADEFYGVLTPRPRGPVARAAPAGPVPTRPAAQTAPSWRADSYSVPHRGGMILVFGILSWVFSCPIFSVMAWVMGSSDLREMRAGRMDSRGMGMTQAGHILGLIYTLLWIVVLVIGMLVFVIGAVV